MALSFSRIPNQNNGQVYYNGHILPQDAKTPQPAEVDPNNVPNGVTFINTDNGARFTLPFDVMIYLDGEKVLAKNNILDAINVGTTIQVVERIARKPYEIEFEFNLWLIDRGAFPQQAINDLWANVWLPDTVLRVVNTYLNGLGVQEVIVEKVSPRPQRGSTNLYCNLHVIENVPGQSLLITSPNVTGLVV